MSTMNCRSDKEKITVGEHVLLACTNNDNAVFDWSKGDFKLAENQKLHFKVFKTVSGETTVSELKLLNSEERITEIAEMLSGKDISDSARIHAKALLN